MRLLKYAELGRYSKLGLYHLRRQVGAAMAALPKGSYAHRVGVKNLPRRRQEPPPHRLRPVPVP